MNETKRRWIVGLGAVSALGGVALGVSADRGTGAPTVAPGPKPNVLLIVTDDQRADTLSVMPATRRWFARAGTRFERAYATTPICCPSRASIFTGRYAHNHGVLDNYSIAALDESSTLQRYLKAGGYTTAIAGKYLNGWDLSRDPPHFDRWAIFRPSETEGYRPPRWNVDGELRDIRGYSTRVLASTSVRWLDRFEADDHSPWALFVFPFAPHKPYTPERRYAHAPVPSGGPPAVEAQRRDKPPWVRAVHSSRAEAATVRAMQLRALMSVDDLVARVARRLRSLDEDRRTIALFLSDNGLLWSEHGLLNKRYPYLEAARIPMLLRWPGHVDARRTDGRLAATIDVAPTVLDAAGIAPPPEAPIDGRSLLGGQERERLLMEFWGAPEVPAWASTVTRNRHYIEYYAPDHRTPIYRELYDLSSDPRELVNLLGDAGASNDPSALAQGRLSARLREDRLCSGPPCP